MRVYLIDGYNVLMSDEGYRALAERDIDTARARLVGDVAAHLQGEADAVVVFDGAANPHSDGEPHDAAGVTVTFSPFGQDADAVIERLAVTRAASGDEVIVVTSDAETQWVVLGHGAIRRSAAGWVQEIRENAEEYGEYVPRGRRGHALDERIDPVVREALARWARGK